MKNEEPILCRKNDEAQPKRADCVIRTIFRILSVSNREIEKELGQSNGYLSRLFAGAIDLKVDHILAARGARCSSSDPSRR